MGPLEWGFCNRTNQPKPPRAHYCHVSKGLVFCLDHYCPWMFSTWQWWHHVLFLWHALVWQVFLHFYFIFISSLFELYAQIVSTVAVKAILQSSWSLCCRTHILFPSSLFRCSCGLFQLPLLCEFSRVCMCFYVVWSKYDLCSVHHAVNACLPRTVASGQTAHESIQFPHIATANWPLSSLPTWKNVCYVNFHALSSGRIGSGHALFFPHLLDIDVADDHWISR